MGSFIDCHVKQHELSLLVKEGKEGDKVLHDRLTQLQRKFPDYTAPEDWLDLDDVGVSAVQLDKLVKWDFLKN